MTLSFINLPDLQFQLDEQALIEDLSKDKRFAKTIEGTDTDRLAYAVLHDYFWGNIDRADVATFAGVGKKVLLTYTITGGCAI